jgi:hypothetical protein
MAMSAHFLSLRLNGLVHLDKGLHHHIHREVFPLEKNAAKKRLITPAFLVFATEGQLAVYVHFAPADLIDSYHRALRIKPVQFAPEPALFFLHRKGRDFGNLRRQFP